MQFHGPAGSGQPGCPGRHRAGLGADARDAIPTTLSPRLLRSRSSSASLAVFRQLNTAIAVSQMSSGQCRLAPLIQVIQDCSHLYHYTVKLMFKLHSCESQGLVWTSVDRVRNGKSRD